MSLQNFTVFGERSSGTELLSKLMIRNFDLPYTQQFGSTHFFGFYDFKNIFTEQTLFLCIVREPVDWLNAFHQNPQYVPLENQELSAFLSKPFYSIWTGTTGTNGLTGSNGLTETNGSNGINTLPYTHNMINEDTHIHTREKYKTIFELRKVKTDYLAKEIPKIVKHTILIRYEDLVTNPILVLEKLQNQFYLTNKLPQYKLFSDDLSAIDLSIQDPKFDDETKQHILTNLDSYQERLLGYCYAVL